MSRPDLVTAVVTYNAKVWLAGLSAALFVPLSLAALAVDLVVRPETSLAQRVLAASARLEASLDVHGDLTDIRVTKAAQASQAPGRAVPSAASA